MVVVEKWDFGKMAYEVGQADGETIQQEADVKKMSVLEYIVYLQKCRNTWFPLSYGHGWIRWKEE